MCHIGSLVTYQGYVPGTGAAGAAVVPAEVGALGVASDETGVAVSVAESWEFAGGGWSASLGA